MSIAQELVNLKKLVIICCFGLEEVIYGVGNGGEEISRGREKIVEQQRHSSSSATNAKIIVFPSLVLISLVNLELKSFYSGGSENCSIKYPSLVDVYINDCESMKIWGPGIHETPDLKSIQLVGD
uniref:uncharacterized protein LOC122609325 n=1 Tax=Erigeron canadensis TaxID=72917 RepID=UPI001CB99C1F|nr:uncharacterized protein LOC122609325 [Erigeron canadensis]